MYFFLEHIFNPNNELSRAQIILLICAYSAVILYILDFNFLLYIQNIDTA
jgi:hypothetical protein